MKGWRVAAWSREQKLGTIVSEVGELPFDARAAKVQDFEPGELVDVVLRDARGGWEVASVAPVVWREDAPPLVASPLPAPLAEALREVTSLLGTGRDLVLLDGGRDVLRLQIQAHEWPPPSMPPIARLELHDVDYVQLPTRTEAYVGVRAFPCEAWIEQRADLVSRWSIDSDDLDRDAYVLRFEPGLFVERAGFVVARSLTVLRTP